MSSVESGRGPEQSSIPEKGGTLDIWLDTPRGAKKSLESRAASLVSASSLGGPRKTRVKLLSVENVKRSDIPAILSAFERVRRETDGFQVHTPHTVLRNGDLCFSVRSVESGHLRSIKSRFIEALKETGVSQDTIDATRAAPFNPVIPIAHIPREQRGALPQSQRENVPEENPTKWVVRDEHLEIDGPGSRINLAEREAWSKRRDSEGSVKLFCEDPEHLSEMGFELFRKEPLKTISSFQEIERTLLQDEPRYSSEIRTIHSLTEKMRTIFHTYKDLEKSRGLLTTQKH